MSSSCIGLNTDFNLVIMLLMSEKSPALIVHGKSFNSLNKIHPRAFPYFTDRVSQNVSLCCVHLSNCEHTCLATLIFFGRQLLKILFSPGKHFAIPKQEFDSLFWRYHLPASNCLFDESLFLEFNVR